MGSGNHQRGLVADKEMTQGLGKRDVGDAAFGQGQGFRVFPPDDIADHHQIRARRKIVRRIAGLDRNALPGQEITHGGIDLLIRAGHGKTGAFQHAGQGAHPGAADAHEMDVPDVFRKAVERRIEAHDGHGHDRTVSRTD